MGYKFSFFLVLWGGLTLQITRKNYFEFYNRHEIEKWINLKSVSGCFHINGDKRLITSSRVSVLYLPPTPLSPHVSARLSINLFLWSLWMLLRKSVDKLQIWSKSDNIGYFTRKPEVRLER